MQLIKVIPHGILKDRFESLVIGATTAAEAIEGWGRQVGTDLKTLVQVVGFNSKDELYASTDVTELHVMPAMIGGGGKGMAIGQIIIGTVMVVAGILLASANPVLAAALIAAGVGMALGGVMQLFMKSPTVSKSNDPEASKYIGSGKNSTAIGTLIGRGGGRMKIGGQFMSIQVNSSDMVYGSYPTTPT